jgi:hypothetical protein
MYLSIQWFPTQINFEWAKPLNFCRDYSSILGIEIGKIRGKTVNPAVGIIGHSRD